MKTLLAALLFLVFLSHAHAQTPWPRNSTTGKVELRGTLPWPAGVKTEAQRRALVRRWYLAKLTSLTAAQVEKSTAANQTNGLLTYAQLPKAVVMQQGAGDDGQLLAYFIQLTPSLQGLQYQLTRFDLERSGDVEAGDSIPLEKVLAAPTPAQQMALVTLRKRLKAALGGW